MLGFSMSFFYFFFWAKLFHGLGIWLKWWHTYLAGMRPCVQNPVLPKNIKIELFHRCFYAYPSRSIIFYLFLLFYYSYVHTRLGSFLPPAPTPSLSPHPLNTQQKLFCPYL
jgi:hypothetical protein